MTKAKEILTFKSQNQTIVPCWPFSSAFGIQDSQGLPLFPDLLQLFPNLILQELWVTESVINSAWLAELEPVLESRPVYNGRQETAEGWCFSSFRGSPDGPIHNPCFQIQVFFFRTLCWPWLARRHSERIHSLTCPREMDKCRVWTTYPREYSRWKCHLR